MGLLQSKPKRQTSKTSISQSALGKRSVADFGVDPNVLAIEKRVKQAQDCLDSIQKTHERILNKIKTLDDRIQSLEKDREAQPPQKRRPNKKSTLPSPQPEPQQAVVAKPLLQVQPAPAETKNSFPPLPAASKPVDPRTLSIPAPVPRPMPQPPQKKAEPPRPQNDYSLMFEKDLNQVHKFADDDSELEIGQNLLEDDSESATKEKNRRRDDNGRFVKGPNGKKDSAVSQSRGGSEEPNKRSLPKGKVNLMGGHPNSKKGY